MVEKHDTRNPPGSVVEVTDRDGQWVGRGFYNGHSRISLRILTADPNEAIDAAFLAQKLDRALALRRDWLKLDSVTDAYRVVHAEADGLSGLSVNKFADIVVIEFFAEGHARLALEIPRLLPGELPRGAFY